VTTLEVVAAGFERRLDADHYGDGVAQSVVVVVACSDRHRRDGERQR
jgi:hypothetical protein